MIDSGEMPCSAESPALPSTSLQPSSSSSELPASSTSLIPPQPFNRTTRTSSSTSPHTISSADRPLFIDLDYTKTGFPSREQNDNNDTLRADDMVHFRYERAERKWNRDDMDVDALFYKLAELNVTGVKVSDAHDLLLAVKHKHIEGFEIDVLKLADRIDRANSNLKELVQMFVEEAREDKSCHESAIESGDDDGLHMGTLKRRETNAQTFQRLKQLSDEKLNEKANAILGDGPLVPRPGPVDENFVILGRPKRRESNAQALERLKMGGWDGKKSGERDFERMKSKDNDNAEEKKREKKAAVGRRVSIVRPIAAEPDMTKSPRFVEKRTRRMSNAEALEELRKRDEEMKRRVEKENDMKVPLVRTEEAEQEETDMVIRELCPAGKYGPTCL